jgi:hypothetical protein
LFNIQRTDIQKEKLESISNIALYCRYFENLRLLIERIQAEGIKVQKRILCLYRTRTDSKVPGKAYINLYKFVELEILSDSD